MTRVLVLGSVLAWLVPSAEAQACSCGHVHELVAPRSETHPASGGVLLSTSCGNPIPIELYQVTVDGIEASLVPDEEVWPLGPTRYVPAYGLAHLHPPAMPGQEVVVTRCGDRDCTRFSEVARYQVTEPIDVPPSLEGGVTLGRAENFFYPDCSEDDLEFVAEVTFSERDRDEGMILRARLQTAEGAPVRTSVLYVEEPADSSLLFFYLRSAELEVQPHELCVDVSALDLSGNETPVASVCGSAPPAEDDPVDDATSGDDDSTSTAGEHASSTGVEAPGQEPSDGPIDRGCSCSTKRTRSPLSWVAMLLVVAAMRRRACLSSP